MNCKCMQINKAEMTYEQLNNANNNKADRINSLSHTITVLRASIRELQPNKEIAMQVIQKHMERLGI